MRRGPLLMIGASLSFTVMVGFVKVARQELSALEVICWRTLTAVPLAALLTHRRGYRIHNVRLMALRCLLGFGAMTCFFTAARGLLLGDLSVITKLQPILIALIAPLLLGRSERSGGRTWFVLVLGIVGCAILLAPDLAVGSVYGLWALGATLFSAGAHTAVRRLGATEDSATLVFWFQLVVAVLAIAGVLVLQREFLPLPAHLWPALVGCGVFATGGQVLMTNAYRVDRASTVAAASYSGPVFGYLGDLLFFAAVPTWNAISGASLVIFGGLVLVFDRDRGAPRGMERSATASG